MSRENLERKILRLWFFEVEIQLKTGYCSNLVFKFKSPQAGKGWKNGFYLAIIEVDGPQNESDFII
jgi:hypothetical protein